jgi:hypothetical protein
MRHGIHFLPDLALFRSEHVQFILAVLLVFAPLLSSSFISPQPLQRANPSLHMGKVEDEAKQVVREYVAAFNAGDMTKLEELLAEIKASWAKEHLPRSSPFGDNSLKGMACNWKFKI